MKTIALRIVDILTRVVVIIVLAASLLVNYLEYHVISEAKEENIAELKRTGHWTKRYGKCIDILEAMPFYDASGQVHYLDHDAVLINTTPDDLED